MKRHLRTHKIRPPEDQPEEEPLITLDVLQLQQKAADADESNERITTMVSRYTKRQLQHYLLTWLCVCHISFFSIEHSTFCDLLQSLNASVMRYLPSANTVKSWTIQRFHHQRDLVKKEVQLTKSLIHLSFDLWSSPSVKALVGIVGHFIDKNFISRTCLLGLREVIGRHTGETLLSRCRQGCE